jgi:hypothetical protein
LHFDHAAQCTTGNFGVLQCSMLQAASPADFGQGLPGGLTIVALVLLLKQEPLIRPDRRPRKGGAG